jgi:regulation of enolase protein 1 (concanavalin A-like superfamily)
MRSNIRALLSASLFAWAATPAALAQTLPTPWNSTDVGSPALGGSASFGSDKFTVNGAGTDIGGTTDQFYFVYRPLSGDGEIVARVESLTKTDNQAKAGVMIRDALTSDSRYAMMTITASKSHRFQRRPVTGDMSISSEVVSGGAPGWVKVARTGDTFAASWSTDGVTWTSADTDTIPMGETVYIGLAVTSRDRRRLAHAMFSNVAVASSASGNQAPAVTLAQPANGAQFSLPANVTIDATATDPEDRMASVGFYVNNMLLTTDTTAAYSASWSPSTAGTYTLAAMAQDADGGSSWSSSVTVTVQGPNSAPSVNLTSPSNDATFTAPATITLAANASDGDGPIDRVEFFSGTTLLGVAIGQPYSFAWSNVAAGSYSLRAVAYDAAGANASSATVTVTVNAPNGAPTVALTSPASGATFGAPATISLTANASDPENQLARVEFLSGTTILGTDTTAPFAWSWANVPAGTYTVTARAYDAAGLTATSAAVSVTVAAAAPPAAPIAVVFTASTDHATNVTSYRLSVFAANANPATATPIATSDLGKPTPDANNDVTVDRASFFSALPGGSYLATVTAIGPGGETQSGSVAFSR